MRLLPALGLAPRPALAPAVASVLAVVLLASLAGCGGASKGAELTGYWEGLMVSENDDEVYEVTLELEVEDGELTGAGRISDDAGTEVPIDVTGGDLGDEGPEVSVEFEDAFGGSGLQGQLTGEVSGEKFSGTAEADGGNSTGPINDDLVFELEKTGEG